ncbi:MAG TPA: hypothetical protein VGQ41_16620 [Pyrinomonadaceae bacterium]|nr:hypothetical protein [Pyrinomonadaceae bacterium]
MRRKNLYRIVGLAAFFSLFQKGAVENATDVDQLESEDETSSRRIRCPACGWQPNKWDLWYCGDCPYPEGFFDGCGMEWNTFDTAGLCPACRYQWRWTSCLRCAVWSLHTDWYTNHEE